MDRFELEPFAAMRAQAIALRLPEIEAIDRMIASFEQRRDAVLQQIEMRREMIARRGAGLGKPDAERKLPHGERAQLEHHAANGQ